LILILVGTIFISFFGKRFYETTRDRTIFEECEEPITVLRLTCINNLRQLEGAKQQWALENNKTPKDIPDWKDVIPYLGSAKTGWKRPWCPQAGVYRLGKVDEAPCCTHPGHMLP